MTSQILARTHQSFDLADDAPSGHGAEEDAPVPIRRLGKMLAAAFLKRCAWMLPAEWRIGLWSKQTDETTIASHGSVQIRHMPGGCLAQTCVKGDITLARGTALLRLAKYVNGDNRRAARLDAEGPLLQQQKAPGLWQVAVRLTAVDDVQMAPVPRARKIRIVAEEPSTWAVITQRGRPTEQAIARGERAIMDTIARSCWFATGKATIRIHAPSSVVPFVGSFEVAVPVSCQPQDRSVGACTRFRDAGRAPTNRPANPPGLPVHRLLRPTARSIVARRCCNRLASVPLSRFSHPFTTRCARSSSLWCKSCCCSVLAMSPIARSSRRLTAASFAA